MSQIVEITINKVEVGVRRDDDADVFVGFCPRFHVYSQADTKDEAIEAVTSAISLRLITAFEHGRMEKILRQAGFDRLISGSNEPRFNFEEEFVSLEVREGVEMTEVGIRVPLGAFLHQRRINCPQ
jgi:predicted RNase H-like HicB family nuclease